MDSNQFFAAEPALGFAIHAQILTYLDLKVILTRMMVLSRDYHTFVKNENYTLYKRFLGLFCLNKSKKKDALIAQCDIL